MELRPSQAARIQTYADALQVKGAALDDCFGFVDSTCKDISPSSITQSLFHTTVKQRVNKTGTRDQLERTIFLR